MKSFRILKLNNSYEPIDIVDWKKAFKLIVNKKVEILKVYDKKINTSENEFVVPAVIRLLNSFKRTHSKINYHKKHVIRRDRNICQYCNKKFKPSKLTIDHVIPQSKGGKTCFENTVACCSECNNKKDNKNLSEVNMKLKRMPFHPNWLPINIFDKSEIPKQWEEFCYYV